MALRMLKNYDLLNVWRKVTYIFAVVMYHTVSAMLLLETWAQLFKANDVVS